MKQLVDGALFDVVPTSGHAMHHLKELTGRVLEGVEDDGTDLVLTFSGGRKLRVREFAELDVL